jgi:hypothetical protein
MFPILPLVLLVLAIAAATADSDAAPPPFTAYGSGLERGDVVEAYIDGAPCGSTVADERGQWLLRIEAGGRCVAREGSPFSFTLNGRSTSAAEIWRAGGAPQDVRTGITLNASSDRSTLRDRTGAPSRDSLPTSTHSDAPAPPFTAYGLGLEPGDTVAVSIDGTSCGSARADSQGRWLLLIEASAPCAPRAGSPIEFFLNGQRTSRTETWHSGGAPSDPGNGVPLASSPAVR